MTADDRSTGVQQGRVEAAARALHRMLEDGGGVTTIPYPESHDKAWWEMCARAVLSAAAEAVSPEPRAPGLLRALTDFYLWMDYYADRPYALEMAEKFLAGGTNKEGVRAEPREGEQELEVIEFADGAKTWGKPVRPPPDPSVASALRLTASRLRDPEYRWYEHAAVTLERLAEELEKDYALAEARGQKGGDGS